MKYLLDTSALLAFYYGEAGNEQVDAIFTDEQNDVELSVLSVAEFWGRLYSQGAQQDFNDAWKKLNQIIRVISPVSLDVVRRSFDLRATATARLPLIDSLIAATAQLHDAILVHRDTHFQYIPAHLLQQQMLPGK